MVAMAMVIETVKVVALMNRRAAGQEPGRKEEKGRGERHWRRTGGRERRHRGRGGQGRRDRIGLNRRGGEGHTAEKRKPRGGVGTGQSKGKQIEQREVALKSVRNDYVKLTKHTADADEGLTRRRRSALGMARARTACKLSGSHL